MQIQLCDKTTEIINFLAKINNITIEFLIEQMLLSELLFFLQGTYKRKPEEEITIFEHGDYPCVFDETINDIYKEYEANRDDCLTRFGYPTTKQINLFEAERPVHNEAPLQEQLVA